MPVPYGKHGRRHAATGEDPIPGVGSPMWPMGRTLMRPGDLNNVAGLSAADWTEVSDPGTTVYGNVYWTNTTGGATDGDFITRIVRLGPQGSIWNVWYVSDEGTDYGKVKFQLASLSENADATVSGFTDVTGAMEATELEGDAVTFYDLSALNGVTHDDHYAAAPVTGTLWEQEWQFRIMGSAGTELTATPTYSANTNTFHANGGPGLYALRLIVDGKNASSTGYRVRVRDWRIYRNTWALLTE